MLRPLLAAMLCALLSAMMVLLPVQAHASARMPALPTAWTPAPASPTVAVFLLPPLAKPWERAPIFTSGQMRQPVLGALIGAGLLGVVAPSSLAYALWSDTLRNADDLGAAAILVVPLLLVIDLSAGALIATVGAPIGATLGYALGGGSARGVFRTLGYGTLFTLLGGAVGLVVGFLVAIPFAALGPYAAFAAGCVGWYGTMAAGATLGAVVADNHEREDVSITLLSVPGARPGRAALLPGVRVQF